MKPKTKPKTKLENEAKIRAAHHLAVEARLQAHAPYSKFQVGAALISKDGCITSGCNIENASYGGTVCAERVAILKSVSEGENKFSDIVVVTDAKTPASPCALCLQVMAEFFDPETRVWIADTERIHNCYRFDEILPKPFGPRELADGRLPTKKAKRKS